ncbi:hypothetical protein J5226_19280 [Lysobacter sp. K5869]|uniref:hypothetical protein n=1 Tax=Lysobacter sp. K5869 TaxID=2820808 RepID=UPI001C05FFCC|nr:hypothetical protein [Lysobacter sp. K5869]QWP75730.1 hypothetical protein J5226_19280 [Lysobacter sp. K5869]
MGIQATLDRGEPRKRRLRIERPASFAVARAAPVRRRAILAARCRIALEATRLRAARSVRANGRDSDARFGECAAIPSARRFKPNWTGRIRKIWLIDGTMKFLQWNHASRWLARCDAH